MQLPNWFKIVWWVLILGALTSFLTVRYPNLSQGQAGPLDTIAFLVWIALLLVPLFSEISIFGVVLKREVEALKAHIEREISSIRADIRNAVEIRTEVNPVFHIPQPHKTRSCHSLKIEFEQLCGRPSAAKEFNLPPFSLKNSMSPPTQLCCSRPGITSKRRYDASGAGIWMIL
jgi:hypothetical protein